MELLEQFAPAFAALVGVPLFITVLVNIGKKANIIKDGQAGKVSQWINLVAFLGLFFTKVFAPDFDLVVLDGIAGSLAELGAAALALIPIWIKLSGQFHGALRGLPLVGKSHSLLSQAETIAKISEAVKHL
jgi:hypothetical protein